MIAVYLLPVYLLVNGYLLHRIFTWLSASTLYFVKRRCGLSSELSTCLWPFLPASAFSRSGRGTAVFKRSWLLLDGNNALHGARCRCRRSHPACSYKNSEKNFHPAASGSCRGALPDPHHSGQHLRMVNARWIRITPYQVKVEKQAGDLDSLKIALVADLHLGYSVGTAQMRQMVDKINAQNPDLVVIAGDIFDNEYEALDDPQELASTLADLESTYGTYACYGNHDIQEPILAGFTFHQDGKR